MTKYARLTNSRLSRRKQASAPKVQTWKTLFSNTLVVNIAMLSLFVVMGVGYLGIVNSAASDTFHVYDLSQRIDDTTQANRDLELAISEVQSLQHVKSMSEQYALIPTTGAEYLDLNSAVALSE